MKKHPNRTRIRTLIADDSRLLRTLIGSYLERHEDRFEIVALACNGKEALQEVTAGSVDLVIMDGRMPVMDGLDATQAIKQMDHPPKIVILTFNDEDSYRELAIKAGADGFCSKNSMADELLKVIDSLFADPAA